MSRLTDYDSDGRWKVKGTDGKFIRWEDVQKELAGALYKLKDYEETGLSPREVEELHEMERWIPVTEMVPGDTDFVLAFVKEGHHGRLHPKDTYCIASYGADCGWILEDHPEVEEFTITHWRPLYAPEEVGK